MEVEHKNAIVIKTINSQILYMTHQLCVDFRWNIVSILKCYRQSEKSIVALAIAESTIARLVDADEKEQSCAVQILTKEIFTRRDRINYWKSNS